MLAIGIEPISPAYGRDYKSKAEVLADFDANKDFVSPSGRYGTKKEFIALGMKTITVRYKKLRETFVINLKPKG